jgi:hypothetical protein
LFRFAVSKEHKVEFLINSDHRNRNGHVKVPLILNYLVLLKSKSLNAECLVGGSVCASLDGHSKATGKASQNSTSRDSPTLIKTHPATRTQPYQETPTMMKLPGGLHDDSTASTANRTAQTNGKLTMASITKKTLSKTQRTKLFSLKFEYNVSSSNVQIAQLHGRVIKAMIASYGEEITV